MFHAPTDVELLFIILAVLYLWETLCRLPDGAACFSSGWGRFRLLRQWLPLGTGLRAHTVADPAPWSQAYVVQEWPFALGPTGCVFYPRYSPSPQAVGRPIGFDYDRIEAIDHRQSDLRVNRRRVARCASPGHARQAARVLRKVVFLSGGDRTAAIEQTLTDALDPARCRAAWESVQRDGRRLRRSCTALFLFTFLIGPFFYYRPPLDPILLLPLYLLGFAWLWPRTILLYAGRRKQALAETFLERWKHILHLFLSPMAAARISESFHRDFLAAYHPAAAALVLLPPEEARAFVERTYSTSNVPLPDDLVDFEASQREQEAWFRGRLMAAVRRAVEAAGIDPASLAERPERLDDARSYCPRCFKQFTLIEGTCNDCPGVHLLRFEP